MSKKRNPKLQISIDPDAAFAVFGCRWVEVAFGIRRVKAVAGEHGGHEVESDNPSKNETVEDDSV